MVAVATVADGVGNAVATMIATESSSPHVPKATAHPRAKAVDAVPAWDNPQALPANPVHHVHRQVSPTRCVPASI
jgi:hypothetical protein